MSSDVVDLASDVTSLKAYADSTKLMIEKVVGDVSALREMVSKLPAGALDIRIGFGKYLSYPKIAVPKEVLGEIERTVRAGGLVLLVVKAALDKGGRRARLVSCEGAWHISYVGNNESVTEILTEPAKNVYEVLMYSRYNA